MSPEIDELENYKMHFEDAQERNNSRRREIDLLRQAIAALQSKDDGLFQRIMAQADAIAIERRKNPSSLGL